MQNVPAKSAARIMMVDDESAYVMIGTKILKSLGYSSTGFTSGAEALEAFRHAPQDFDAVISDLTMPGVSGLELVAALLEMRPNFRCILVTGRVEKALLDRAAALGVREILNKPATVQAMREALERVLA